MREGHCELVRNFDPIPVVLTPFPEDRLKRLETALVSEAGNYLALPGRRNSHSNRCNNARTKCRILHGISSST